jgi:hypothetical protein
MTGRDSSSGGMTGATGDLTPDEIQRDFEPGEWREASDPEHQGDVTRSHASHSPSERGNVGQPGPRAAEHGPTELATRESGSGSEHGLSPEDPAYRMETRPETPPAEGETGEARESRIGGDERQEHEDHF